MNEHTGGEGFTPIKGRIDNRTSIPDQALYAIGPLEKFEQHQDKLLNFLEKIPPAETVVACGKGWFVDPQGKRERFNDPDIGFSQLVPEARMTSLAAGILLLSGKAGRVIVTGGPTAGNEHDTEAQAMKAFMKKIFGDSIQDEQILTENQSFDTGDNARYSREMGADKSAIVLTVGYHEPRTRMLFDREWGKKGINETELPQDKTTGYKIPGDKYLMLKSDELVRLGFPEQRYLTQLEKHHPEKLALETLREGFARLLYSNEATAKFIQKLAAMKRGK